jgi:teichuronic acid biosynthesis glycosyltransferase TuaG
MDKISIIIPYFNKKQFIKKTLKSILNQSYANFEIIIIYDDQSKKDLEYIKSLKVLDKRIKIIINEKNIGAGLSRNRGVLKSQGKYIAFIDADDTWHRSKLSLQLKLMKKKNYDITHTSYNIVSFNGKKISTRKARDITKLEDLVKSCDIGLSTVMLRKKILNSKLKFASIKTKEDFVLWLRILQENYKIYALNKNLTSWTNSKNSLSSSIFQKLVDGYRVYYKYLNKNMFDSIYLLFCLSINYLLKK